MTTIFHNPRCSKSRQTLQLLEENGIHPEVRLYLQNTPSIEEIKTLLEQLPQLAGVRDMTDHTDKSQAYY